MQNSQPIGFCYIIDKNGHTQRGFFRDGVKEGVFISDEIKDHYLKLNYTKGFLNEDMLCFSKQK